MGLEIRSAVLQRIAPGMLGSEIQMTELKAGSGCLGSFRDLGYEYILLWL